MKNLRKTVCIAIALVLVFVVSGCGTAYNTPGTNTGNRALGTGNAYNMGTNALTNIGMNLGTNPGTNLGMNNWMNPGYRTGNVAANPRTGMNYGFGTGLHNGTGTNYGYGTGTNYGYGTGTNTGTNYGYGTGMNYGTGMFPGTTGTNVGTTRYKDGVYTAAYDRRPNGCDTATVTIRGGRIQHVAFKRIDGNGNIMNNSTITGMAGRTGMDNLARQIVARQGANLTPTGTRPNADTTGYTTACRRALDKART